MLFINGHSGTLIKVNELGKTIVGFLEWKSTPFSYYYFLLLKHFDLEL